MMEFFLIFMAVVAFLAFISVKALLICFAFVAFLVFLASVSLKTLLIIFAIIGFLMLFGEVHASFVNNNVVNDDFLKRDDE